MQQQSIAQTHRQAHSATDPHGPHTVTDRQAGLPKPQTHMDHTQTGLLHRPTWTTHSHTQTDRPTTDTDPHGPHTDTHRQTGLLQTQTHMDHTQTGLLQTDPHGPHTDTQTHRQTHRQAGRQAGRQARTHARTHTHTHTHTQRPTADTDPRGPDLCSADESAPGVVVCACVRDDC